MHKGEVMILGPQNSRDESSAWFQITKSDRLFANTLGICCILAKSSIQQCNPERFSHHFWTAYRFDNGLCCILTYSENCKCNRIALSANFTFGSNGFHVHEQRTVIDYDYYVAIEPPACLVALVP